ncbi:MAG: type VII secretion-associated serine protease mycosin [Pseudonocardia sp.]
MSCPRTARLAGLPALALVGLLLGPVTPAALTPPDRPAASAPQVTPAALTPPDGPAASAPLADRFAHGAAHPVTRPAPPPEPPPVRAAAPAARVPGAAAGVRVPQRCEPPVADLAAAADVSRSLRLTAVHRLATGAGQTIAVIDTGVAQHDRLAGRLRGVGDFLTGADGRSDCDGHGTAVAGLLAAAPAADDDFVGMAPAATLLTIRQTSRVITVTGGDGRARPAGDVDTLAAAVVLAVERGAKVINLSEAACLAPEWAAREGAVLQAALRLAARRDVVVVAAAGNIGVGGCTGGAPAGEVALPGWFGDDVLTVAATGPDDAPAPFTVPGPWVDVAAPGTGLRSLAIGGGLTTTGVEGTSFAAPWVAGLAALVRERFPQLTAAEVTDRILATARRAPGGHDPHLGLGIVDPVAALTAEPAVLRPDPARVAVAPTVLAGTRPAGPPPQPRAPVELLALAALAGTAGAGVAVVRRRGARA